MTEIPPAAMTDAAADSARSAGLYPGAFTPLEDVRFRLAATYQEFGYRAVEVPVQAPAAIFERKAGSRVIPKIYVLPHSTDQRICLRPEFTPLLVQLFNVRRDAIGIPARLHYGGPVFRRRSGGGGEPETYHESGAELFGVTGPEADAEVLSMAIASLRAAGAPEPIVTIGHIDVITSFLHDLELPPAVYETLMDGLAWDVRDPDPQELEQKVLEKIGVPTPSSASSARLGEITREDLHAIGSAMLASLDIPLTGRRTHEEVVERMISRLTASQVGKDVRHAISFTHQLREAAGPWQTALDATENVLTAADRDLVPVAHLRNVLALLEAGGVDSSAVRVDLALGRGLQYYTGLVFEIIAAGGTRVAGGGRYDDLVGLLGGADTAAVGFTIRIDPLADLLQHAGCQEGRQ